ncbi:hypothetical protein [Mucisphaera sp.]|uniref:hypothetical protein n=1 Tax=Mucisphaera sp. TaxID=2913024 RepID=UPI003D0C6030
MSLHRHALIAIALGTCTLPAAADVTYTFDDVTITSTQNLVFSNTFVIDTTVGETFEAIRLTFDWTSIGDDPEVNNDGAFSRDLGATVISDNNFVEFGATSRIPGTFSDDLPIDDLETTQNFSVVEGSGSGYSIAFQMFDDSLFGSTSVVVSDIRLTLLNNAIDVPTLAELAEPLFLPINSTLSGDTSIGSTDDVDGRFGPGPSTTYNGPDDVWPLNWPGGDLQLSLDFDDTIGDLDLFLFDSTDTLVRRSANVGGPESLIEPELTAGLYYVVVDGWQGDSAPYELTASVFVEIDGDYDLDGALDLGDLDLLFAELLLDPIDQDIATFDANGDTVLDSADISFWVSSLFGSADGDSNLDGTVDLIDLSNLASNFGAVGQPLYDAGNFNGDDAVDLIDLSLLATNFGFTNTIPEPASALLALGGLLTLRRRG